MAIKKLKKTKEKRDIRGMVHRFCRIAIFRTLEALLIFFVVSILVLLIGGYVVPMMSLSTADGIGLTQSTDYYTAMANWILPMQFYVILAVLATFCVLKKFITFVHNKFTIKINKTENEGTDV